MKKAVLLSVITVNLFTGLVSADTFGTGANQFDIDFVGITAATNPTSGYGIVNNDYRMGTHEITNGQWDKFKANYGTVNGNPSNAYNTDPYWTGSNTPCNGVSWYEAAQFVNWLNTSNGHHAAYNFTGAQGTLDYTFTPWDITDTGYDASNPYRNSNAFYFVPTENEWVKAAYWNGKTLQTYATKPGDTLHQGNGVNGTGWNYWNGDYATDFSGPWNVGSGSEELNGTYDMMGNVVEWMENPYYSGGYASNSYHSFRGGAYRYTSDYLRSSYRSSGNPTLEIRSLGFRVASIPEPTTLSLLALGAFFAGRKRR